MAVTNSKQRIATFLTGARTACYCIAVALLALAIAAPSVRAQAATSNVTPDWCRQLPRPQYKTLERVPSPDDWFEVYRVAPGVFAIYEPHQFEEAISFLILGEKRAALFDTGMGIGDIKHVVQSLTSLPVVVLNSHTHNDHVGDNWEFSDIYGMDTDFTRLNAKGSSADAQAELVPGSVCGQLPAGFDAKSYSTRPFHISKWMHDGDTIDLGERVLQVISTPGHTPDAICLLTARMDCCSQETLSTTRQSGSTGRKRISRATFVPLSASRPSRPNLNCSFPLTTFPSPIPRNCRSW
jgi:hypothetical protein